MLREWAGTAAVRALIFLGPLLQSAAGDFAGERKANPDVCQATREDDDGPTSINQVNLTEKLWIDCGCFAVGVLVATWKLLRRVLPFWRTGCRRGLERCQRWCRGRGRQVRSCCRRLYHRQTSSDPLLFDISSPGSGWRLSSVTAGKPLAFTNYFRYLGTCCLTFLILFIVSQGLGQIFKVDQLFQADLAEKEEDIISFLFLQPGSVFVQLNKENMDTIFGWVLSVVYINGLVFLAATYVLEKWCDQPEVHEKVSRAIWVHGLPVKDQRLNPFVREPFRLTFAELNQVERELGARFNDELNRRRDRRESPARDRLPRTTANQARFMRSYSFSFDSAPVIEDEGEWVVDDTDAHLPHHERREPSEGLSVGNHVGAKGIFKDVDGRAVFVRKVLAASRIENVWVVPVAKQWIEACERLEDAFNQQRIYRLWALAYQLPGKTSFWESTWRRWYQFRSTAVEAQVGKLEAELLRIRLLRLRMCGSAFVLFREMEDCQSLLGRAPFWWNCQRWMCWFNLLKFGHVPFTSVTLEYEPAPHPEDINWQNMDTPRWWSETVFVFLTIILMLFMLAGQAVIMWILSFGSYGEKVSQHFASLALLFINRSVLPFPVEWIALAGKFRRKTEGELRQMHLNFWLLMVNTIVVPVLGLQIAQQIPPELKKSPSHFLWCVSFRLLKLPKRLFVGYLFDVTFLTNLYQVLAGSLFRIMASLQRKLTAVLPPDASMLPPDIAKRLHASGRKTTSECPALSGPQYGFGYYYAWTLSIVALVLLASAELPITLFIAAICFAVKIVVDWCNLQNRVYEIGPEHEGVLITWAIFYLRLCVSLWWFLTSLGIQQLCADETVACPGWAMPTSIVLLSLAGLVIVLSTFRVSYAIATRRFFPGRLKQGNSNKWLRSRTCEPQLDWDAAPQLLRPEVKAEAANSSFSFASFSESEASSSTAGASHRWRPAFATVESVVEEVEGRPFLGEFVQRLLDEGQGVHDILVRIRRAQYRKAVTGPAHLTLPDLERRLPGSNGRCEKSWSRGWS